MKRITLDGLLKTRREQPYQEQYKYVREKLEKGEIKPVKASGTNGKTPALYLEYWLVEEEKDYSNLLEELKYNLSTYISVDYYLAHPDIYEKERPWVLMLSGYLKEHMDALRHSMSLNERSFEIWNREKFLSKEQGKRILKHCRLELEFLHTYETTEPLAYYSHTRKIPQNLLILENKDPFYSMRTHLLEGRETILGEQIGTLIYGAGKGILRSFSDFDLCVEPYMREEKNRLLYFGDLDYEGIGIYENLHEIFRERWEIQPFIPGYEAMLRKSENVSNLPETKAGQNRNLRGTFFTYFDEKTVQRMKKILEADTYIPQEILNIGDF